MAETPLVSIIIRARNEEVSLRQLLPILQQQHTDFPFEIWLLDNESTDGTAALAQEYGLQYHFIPRYAFNYASALNLGASLAQGEILVYISAHCFPQGEYWLSYLVEPLRNDPTVVGSYGRQWTDPRTSPFESLGNDSLFPIHGQPSQVAFSNANSAVRKSHVLLHPFNPAIRILEDHLFYLEMGGEYRVVYAPGALVNHEHESFSWRYYVRRWIREGWSFFFLTDHRGLQSPFAPRPILNLRNLFRHYPHLAFWFGKQRKWKTALLTLPFFWMRDTLWFIGWIRAFLKHRTMSQQDTSLLLQMNRSLLRQLLDRSQTPRPNPQPAQLPMDLIVPPDWPEEWKLKADWAFIRDNVASFIRSCHEGGLIATPMLEVGAAGQNDYLKEWYEMITSNIDTNLQGSDVPLDMENMYAFADNSLGTVLCSEVIEHVFHPDRAIAEAFRVLRPGGTLIITTPYSIVIHNSVDDGGFHGRNFTPQGLELVVREAGFEIEVLETRGLSPTRQQLMPSNIFAVGRKPSSSAAQYQKEQPVLQHERHVEAASPA